MRQFLTLGFWMSLFALAGLTVGLWTITRDDVPAVDDAVVVAPEERPIDLIGMVFLARADPGFDIVAGRTVGDLQIRVDGFRYMNVKQGTPGENRCGELDQLARCAVVADLLGEAVLWFSIVPLSPRNLVELPGPAELRDGGRLELQNGWIVDRADVVERECPEDTASLSEFTQRFGEGATSVFSLAEQQVIRVRCSEDVAVPSGT